MAQRFLHAKKGRENGDVVLFVDTFNRYFEPENARAALKVLEAAGYRVHAPRGLCCGRTFLSAGLVEEAKKEARKMVEALAPYVAKGVPIVGLEPSCLFSLRDEFTVMAGHRRPAEGRASCSRSSSRRSPAS